MYFSNKEYYDHLNRDAVARARVSVILGEREGSILVTPQIAAKALHKVKQTLLNRVSTIRHPNMESWNSEQVSKWLRPWNVVPKLRDFRPPMGDYGVGVEVELGFETIEGARTVAKHVQHWKYITLDFEGGTNPIELTFPPIPYSTLGKRSQVVRYLNYLTANRTAVGLRDHAPGNTAGTHINVSCGHRPVIDYSRITQVNSCLYEILGYRAHHGWGYESPQQEDLAEKYFGRRPYGFGYSNDVGNNKWIEWKLFHSTVDSKRFMQYVNVAVSLTRLVCGNAEITVAATLQALEDGHTGNIRKLIKADKEAAATATAAWAADAVCTLDSLAA